MERSELEELTKNLASTARGLIESEGRVTPISFIIPASKEERPALCGMAFNSIEQKRQIFSKIESMAKQMNAVAVIFVADSWIKQMPRGTPVEEAMSQGSPEFDPARTEAIVAKCTSAIGETYMVNYPYHRDGETIVWGEVQEIGWQDTNEHDLTPKPKIAPLSKC